MAWITWIYEILVLLLGRCSYIRVNDAFMRTRIVQQYPTDRHIPPLIAATLAEVAWLWFMLTGGRRK